MMWRMIPPGISTQYRTSSDKLAVRYEATGTIAVINEWL